MKLAFTTLACPGWTLEQAVDAGRRYGYEGLELRLLDGEIVLPTLDQASRQRVQRVCKDAAMPIICLDTSVRIAQPDATLRAAQISDGMALLEIAAAWETPFIRVFGGPPDGVSEADAIDAAAACLAPLEQRGQELGVTVILETHDAFASGAAVGQVLRQVPGAGAGALWDTLHPQRVGESIDETLQQIGDRLLHVHIKDGRRPPDNGPNWELTLLGEGDVAIPAILAALRERGYQGWLSVEWEKKWHPDLADPEVALPQHIAALRSYEL